MRHPHELRLIPTSVKVTYFKPSGKYYTSSSFDSFCHEDDFHIGLAVDEILSRRDFGDLPGLESGRWNGPILIEANDVPHLITH